MGTPKQLLNWGHGTLLDSAVANALQLNSNHVYVVLGANYDLIAKTIKQPDSVTVLKNNDWQNGLGSSIACAVHYLLKSKSQVEGLLIMLADQPLIDVDFLKKLIDNFKINENLIVATSYEDKNQGVPVIFDASYFNQLSTLHDDFGAKSVLNANKSHIKTLTPRVKNVDLDSKEDYEALFKANFDT